MNTKALSSLSRISVTKRDAFGKALDSLIDWESVDQAIDIRVKSLSKELYSSLELLREKVEIYVGDLDVSLKSFQAEIDAVRSQLDDSVDMRDQDRIDLNDRLERMLSKVSDYVSSSSTDAVSKSEKSIRTELKSSLILLKKSLDGVKKDQTEHQKNSDGFKYKSQEEIMKLHDKFGTLEVLVGKIPTDVFEFGSQLSVMLNGVFTAITGTINFKNGSGTTVTATPNGLAVDIAVNASGSFSGSQEKSTTVPNSSLTTFSFTHTPKVIFWNGAFQTLTDDYTVSSNNITFSASAGVPQTGDKVINLYA